MAGSTNAHIKNLRDSTHDKNMHHTSHSTKGAFHSDLTNEKKVKKNNPFEVMKETVRYEKYSKYWSILSNIAAIVSVSSAIYGTMKKRSWF